jgi:hypothetical protein
MNSNIGAPCTFARLLLMTLASLLLLGAALQAQAESFGRQTVGTVVSGGLRGEYKRGSKFALSRAGQITQICGYVDGNGGASGTQKLRYALYRDTGGTPGAKIVATEEVDIAQGMGAQWLCLETGFMPLAPGSYWLMLHSSSPAGVARFYYDGAKNFYGNGDSFENGAADSFGAGAPGDGTLSLYATYVPSTAWHTVGRTSVGREARQAAYDYARGSSFVLTETARLNSLTAYMGDTGHGFVYNHLTWDLYQDENGMPTKHLISGGGPFVARRFGRTSVASKVADTLAENYIHASRFTLPDTGASITAIRAYLDGRGGGTGRQWLRVSIFNDIGAKQLVAISDLTYVDAGAAPGWVEIPMLTPQSLPKGNYWVGIQSGFPTNVARVYGDGTANELHRPREDATAGVHYLDPPDTPAQRGNVTLSMYVDYMVPQK